MKKRQGLLISFVFMCLLLTFSFKTAAALPNVTAKAPIYASGWRQGAYQLYSDSGLTKREGSLSYRHCLIVKIQDKAALISYQSGGAKKQSWVPLSRFIYNPDYQHQIAYANSAVKIRRRPSRKAPAVTVRIHSGGIEVGQRGSWKQVLFKSGNKYHLGWMPKSSFRSAVRLSMDTTTQVLADGVYTFTRKGSRSALTYDQSTNSFKLQRNTGAAAQRFKITHRSRDYYQITPQNATGNLVADNNLSVQADNSQYWLLRRTGAYFYIGGSGKKMISAASGRVQIIPWKRISANQWQIKKITSVPTQEEAVVFSQYDPKWAGNTYYKGRIRRTISTSGCGVLALTNAIYALNGEFINPTTLARFSARRGHYVYMAGTNDTLYKDFAKKYGKTYHFKHSGKVYSMKKMRTHLQKGGTALALVPGHFIAITAYRKSDNKYLVLDSAVYGKRPTTINGDWVAASELQRNNLKCEYFHLFSRR